ncbi:MAG: hypothetical protein HYZ53_07455 [Planctomycetes bacterium]|nr:hypothetical protein [Planctomycetota bacterium]
MALKPLSHFTWEGAAENLDRLAIANRRALLDWLDSLTTEESIRVFENLSGSLPEFHADRLPKPPPVVLFPVWRP